MAKLILTLISALSLFILFPLSDSLPTSDLNGGDVLLLPSDIPRAVPDADSLASVAEPKPTIAESEHERKGFVTVPDTDSLASVADPNPAIAEPEHEPEGFVTVPLTKLDFHEGSMPLSLRFPHRRRFGRGCRHGFMRRHGMPYGNDMILSNGRDRAEEFVGRSRFHSVNRRPRFEVAAPWKGEEDVFQRPKKFERGFDEEDMFKRPKKFRHHDEDDDHVFKRPKEFDDDDEDHMFEMVNKLKHDIFRTPRKFRHHDDDDDDWHKEKHHHRHHHKHHHDDDDDDEDGAHEHGKHRHHDDDEDDKSGILSKMRKFFDDLF